mgnify:CR=1 FL=1
MACTGNKAPINITQINNNTIETCEVTCSFDFAYGSSSCNVTPNGNYLSYKYDGNTKVSYNTSDKVSNYVVNEIRIYSPPLNKYTTTDNNNAVAELFVHHTSSNTGKNLLLCIPLAVKDIPSKSSEVFSQIISTSIEQDGGEQSINVSNFTLESLIPITEFYSYNGDIPYSPTGNNICSGTNANIIIFPADGTINMNSQTLSTLRTLITNSGTTTHQNPDSVNLRYNKDGTLHNASGGGDDIYIECNPVGHDGEIIENVANDTTSGSESQRERTPMLDDKTKKIIYDVLISLFGILIGGIIIYYSAKYINSYLSKEANLPFTSASSTQTE